MDRPIHGSTSARLRHRPAQAVGRQSLRQPHAAANRPVHRRRAGLIALLGAVVMLTVACSAWSSANSHPAERPIASTTYYLSPSGSDAAAGISPAKAWRTLGRASRAVLRPGDRLLLEGGQQFSGQLTIGESDGGDVARPLTIGSYGDGPATIMSASFAIYVHDASGVDITGLNVVGQPSGGGPPGPGPQLGGSNGAGVNIYNDLPAGHRLSGIVISHVYASGFDNGIAVGGGHSGAGFSNVQISDCLVSGNVDAGLESYGQQFDAESPNYANQNVTVSDVVASQNQGDPRVTSHNTGNGIVLGSVRDGTIERSTADSNGGAGGDTAQGPTGIWAYDSRTFPSSTVFLTKTRPRIKSTATASTLIRTPRIRCCRIIFPTVTRARDSWSTVGSATEPSEITSSDITSVAETPATAALSTVVSRSSARRQG